MGDGTLLGGEIIGLSSEICGVGVPLSTSTPPGFCIRRLGCALGTYALVVSTPGPFSAEMKVDVAKLKTDRAGVAEEFESLEQDTRSWMESCADHPSGMPS